MGASIIHSNNIYGSIVEFKVPTYKLLIISSMRDK